jgi:uncharacterized membrane protein
VESLDETRELTDQIIGLLELVSVPFVTVLVSIGYYKTRSLVILLVAGFTGGVVLWMIHNPDWFQNMAEEEGTQAPYSGYGPPRDAQTTGPEVLIPLRV